MEKPYEYSRNDVLYRGRNWTRVDEVSRITRRLVMLGYVDEALELSEAGVTDGRIHWILPLEVSVGLGGLPAAPPEPPAAAVSLPPAPQERPGATPVTGEIPFTDPTVVPCRWTTPAGARSSSKPPRRGICRPERTS